jgi:anti-sigma factor RsiW
MTCASVDLKAYLLGEIPSGERAVLEDHVRACPNCQEEADRLRLTQTALHALPYEEVPQRIAFVSDKVFAPRWWQKIWRSGPAMGFASTAVLAGAILVHGFAVRSAVTPVTPAVDTAKIEQRIEQEVNARIDAAVAKAVSETDARQEQQFAKTLDAAEHRYELQRRVDLAAVQQTMRFYDQQMGRLIVASNDFAQERTAR